MGFLLSFFYLQTFNIRIPMQALGTDTEPNGRMTNMVSVPLFSALKRRIKIIYLY